MARKISDTIAAAVSSAGATCKSLIKVVLQSRPSHVKRALRDAIIILGNGPSLNDTIAQSLETLLSTDTMAVNFAANAPVFTTIRPGRYILADPHFFDNKEDANVDKLMTNLAAVDWPMVLYVPMKAHVDMRVLANSHITVERFNFVGAEGASAVVYPLYDRGLAMPRPRNVLIPAIMTAIRAGYKTIYITGADHTWTRTLSVDNSNCVVSVQPHFYQEDSKESERVTAVYRDVKLHEILLSFHIAFRSYHAIAAYARSRRVAIYNATPGSFIDAFPRRPLPTNSANAAKAPKQL